MVLIVSPPISPNSSGVRLDKTKSCRPWRAQISVASRFKHLGYFDTAEEAARAYDTAARHYFKDDAVLNYFDDGTRNYLAAGKRRQLGECVGENLGGRGRGVYHPGHTYLMTRKSLPGIFLPRITIIGHVSM